MDRSRQSFNCLIVTLFKPHSTSIRDDLDIESTKGLAYQSVKNSIPLVLQALATLLSSSLTDDSQKLEDKGLQHGIVRTELRYC